MSSATDKRLKFYRQVIYVGLITAYKQRNPSIFRLKGSYKNWHRLTLPRFTAVPSALAGLTSLFGMGRGGHRRYRHLKAFRFEY